MTDKIMIVPEDWGHMVPDRFMEKLFTSDRSTVRMRDTSEFPDIEHILEWWELASPAERADGFDDVLAALEVKANGRWWRLEWDDGAIVGVR